MGRAENLSRVDKQTQRQADVTPGGGGEMLHGPSHLETGAERLFHSNPVAKHLHKEGKKISRLDARRQWWAANGTKKKS